MTVAQLRSDLQASRERLFAQVRGLTEEQFRHVPSPDGWSIATHLAHLLRVERLFAERAALALREDEPRFESTQALNDDEPARAQHLAVPQIIHGMQAARRALEQMLDACDEAALARGGVHSTRGRMTVADMIVKMADHEREHGDAIERAAREALSSAADTIPLAQRS